MINYRSNDWNTELSTQGNFSGINNPAIQKSSSFTFTTKLVEKLNQVIDYLKENYRYDISREGLACAMNLSPDHMSRKFKAYTGYRISDFIERLRIKEAMRYLIHTEMSVAEITRAVGFGSQSTFNRAFKRVKAMTPLEFRMQFIEKDRIEHA